jgi:hypothetical protein
MATLARQLTFPNLSLKNILFGLMIVAILIGLFFIPEILNYQKRAVSNATGAIKTEEVEKPQSILQPSTEVNTERSPLDEVLYLMESGHYAPKTRQAATKNSVEQIVADTSILTWDNLKSGRGEASLRNAQNVARMLLIANEQKENAAVKKALVSFIGGVDYVLGEASKVMNAQEAGRYLQGLDIEVARALSTVRADYIRWSEVSIAEALGSQKSIIAKQQGIQPFDPKLLLQNVWLVKAEMQPNDKRKPRTYVNFQGTVNGDDVQTLSILKNGLKLRDIPMDVPDIYGRRWFYYNTYNADGVWTLRATDKLGNVYEKDYQFFPKIEKYERDDFSQYILPYQQEGGDPRMDRLFATNVRRPGYDEKLLNFVAF